MLKNIYFLFFVFFMISFEAYSQDQVIRKIFTIGKAETFQVGTKVLCIRGPGIAHENTYFEYRTGKNDNEYIIELKSYEKIIQRINSLERNVDSLKKIEKSFNEKISKDKVTQNTTDIKESNIKLQKNPKITNDTILVYNENKYIAPNPGLDVIIQSNKTIIDFDSKINDIYIKNKSLDNEYQNNINRINYLSTLKNTNPDLANLYLKEMDSLKAINDLLSLEKQKLNVENILLSDAKKIAELQTASLRNLVFLIAISAILLAIIAIIIFVNYLNKRKLNKKLNELNSNLENKNTELTNKNEQIFNQNLLIKEQNKEITDSIEYAKRIQNAILPNEIDIRKIFPYFYILYLPRDIVSGDFYWFYHSEEFTFISLADCTGHGVPGAFMSMIGNELLNEIVISRKIIDPDMILEELNNGLRKTLHQNNVSEAQDGMDIGLIRIEPDMTNSTKLSYKINFAGAKISLFYIINNELFEIKGTRKSIGGKQKELIRKFDNNELLINDNCQMYLVSDGFADLHSSTNEKYGPKKVKEFILENSKKNFESQKLSFEAEINNFKTTEKIRDDISIICLKLN